MLQVKNASPFTPALAVFPDREGIDTLYVIVKGTYTIAPRVAIAEVQVPPVAADEYWGEPGASSLRYASEMHLGKPSSDVVLVGKAWAPQGRPTPEGAVMVSVAGRQKVARVYGERVWKGRGLSHPEPFLSLPLVYERSFGGSYRLAPDGPLFAEERNPVGKGFLGKRSPDDFAGQNTPNFEHPTLMIQRLGDTPPPVGFGFVAPSWLPRRSFAGTYDKAWQKTRAPYLPADFNPAFFNCASPDLVMPHYLKGGEPVKVVGASRTGSLHFEVPSQHPKAAIKIAGSVERPPCQLETFLIEPEENRFCVTWRASLRCDKKVLKVEEVAITL
jgi:hypothetical protein